MSTSAVQGRRVLVTGAGGFIGSALCRRLVEEGAQVVALLRRDPDLRLARAQQHMECLKLNMIDDDGLTSVVRRHRPEIVFHSAMGSSYRGPSGLSKQSRECIQITANLLEAVARAPGTRSLLVHLSSSLVCNVSEGAMAEDEPVCPRTQRGALKAAAEQLVSQQARAGVVPAVIVRPFSVYGPWEQPDRLIPTAIRAALCREALPLADGTSRRDFVYLDDVVSGCLLAASGAYRQGEVFNLGSGVERSNRDVIAMVERLSKVSIELQPGCFPARVADRPHWRADTRRASAGLGWRATTSFREGIARTIEWYRDQLNRQ